MPLDIPAFIEKKNALDGEAFLLLIEIQYATGQYVRWAAQPDYATAPQFRRTTAVDPITFEGNLYSPFPIGKPRRGHNSRGEIPTFEFVIANPQRIFESVLQTYIVEGKTGRLITVDRDNLDDPTAKAEEWFTIERASSAADRITLSCKGVRFNPLRSRIPRKNITRNRFPGVMGSTRNRFY